VAGETFRYFDVAGTPWAAVFHDGTLVWEGELLSPEQLPAGMIDGLLRRKDARP
jgi:hypothetical protein